MSAVAATPNDLYPLIGFGALKACQREIIITFPPKIPTTFRGEKKRKKRKVKEKGRESWTVLIFFRGEYIITIH
jgi:hypothetical protein